MNKYRNKRVTYYNINFQSIAEGQRYLYLRSEAEAGRITQLVLQPRFLLQGGFLHEGAKIRKIEYVADFSYYKDGVRIIEDVKGKKTDAYNLKKKFFLKKYGKELKFMEII